MNTFQKEKTLTVPGCEWWYAENKQAIGPFTEKNLAAMVRKGIIKSRTLVFKNGWTGWQTWQDVAKFYSAKSKTQSKTDSIRPRRLEVKQLGIQGSAVIHDNKQIIKGQIGNISNTGIFIETSESLFSKGTLVNVTIKMPDLVEPFNVACKVIRTQAKAPHSPSGYGLVYESFPAALSQLPL